MVIVFERLGRPLGLLAAEPLDMLEAALNSATDTVTLRQRGIGRLRGAQRSAPSCCWTFLNWPTRSCRKPSHPRRAVSLSTIHKGMSPTVLVADDSEFFRGQIQRLVEAVGCKVLAAEDGQAAWEILDQHAGEVDLLATNVEMPRLDGLSLTRRIRADQRFAGLPVIALSSARGRRRNRSRLGRWRG